MVSLGIDPGRERQVQQRRLRLRLSEPFPAPNGQGVLVIDEHGVSLRGHKTAHIGKQCLAKPFVDWTHAWCR